MVQTETKYWWSYGAVMTTAHNLGLASSFYLTKLVFTQSTIVKFGVSEYDVMKLRVDMRAHAHHCQWLVLCSSLVFRISPRQRT